MVNKTWGGDLLGSLYSKEEQEKLFVLKAQSKPLDELVVHEKFTVNSVDDFFALKYQDGMIGYLSLNVTPYNSEIPVETLKFIGFSEVKVGDLISAAIPRYEGIKNSRLGLSWEKKGKFYVDRDFYQMEHPTELSILDREGNILRTDRAINYEFF